LGPIKVGVVGVGHLGREHARIYASLPDVELVGVSDRDRSRASAIASKYGTGSFSDHSELLEMASAVSVAVPTIDHCSLVRDAFEAGTHVLVEKPITSTVDEAAELVEMAKARGLILQVGHVERYNPAVQAITERVTRPLFIECHRLAPFGNRGTDVSVVLDVMIHDLDIVLGFVKSAVKRIDAIGIPVLSPLEDIANARLEFESGCIANLTASRVSAEKMRKIRIFQGDSYISLDYVEQAVKLFRRVSGESAPGIMQEEVHVTKDEPLRVELMSFISSIREGKQPLVSGYDGKRALEVARRIVDAIQARRQAMMDCISLYDGESQSPRGDVDFLS
jgi:predicted dehydrogenase